MNRSRVWIGMLLIAAIAAPAAMAANVEGFLNTWSAAQKAAQEKDKPIYLHFTTEWCGWCRKIEQDTYPSEVGKKALGNFVAASLDCTVPRGQQPTGEKKVNLELMEKWGGRGYPFLVMVTPDGEHVLNTISGYVPPEQFEKETAQALDLWKEYQALQKMTDTKSFEYHAKAAKVYGKLNEYEKATPHAKAVLESDKATDADKAGAHLVLVLNAEKAGKADDAAKHFDALKSLDPKNEYGMLEEAVEQRVQGRMQALRTAAGEDAQKKLLGEIRDNLSLLTAEGIKVSDAFGVYYMIGRIEATLGNTDKAVAALNKAIEHAPSPEAAEGLRKAVQQMQAAEEGQ